MKELDNIYHHFYGEILYERNDFQIQGVVEYFAERKGIF